MAGAKLLSNSEARVLVGVNPRASRLRRRFPCPNWNAIRVPIAASGKRVEKEGGDDTEHRDQGEAVKAVIEILTGALVPSRVAWLASIGVSKS